LWTNVSRMVIRVAVVDKGTHMGKISTSKATTTVTLLELVTMDRSVVGV
jgi:hypothetical protein